MSKQRVRMNKKSIAQLPNAKPGVYVLKNNNGTSIFAGIAKRGKVYETLQEHFYGGESYVPGAWVEFQQFNNLTEANERLKIVLEKDQPKYN